MKCTECGSEDVREIENASEFDSEIHRRGRKVTIHGISVILCFRCKEITAYQYRKMNGMMELLKAHDEVWLVNDNWTAERPITQ